VILRHPRTFFVLSRNQRAVTPLDRSVPLAALVIDAIIKFEPLSWLSAAPTMVNTRKITGFFVVGDAGDSSDKLKF